MTVETNTACGAETQRRSPQWLAYAGLVLAIGLAIGIRFPLLDAPLERDEGEYAYAAQLILDGIGPYQMAYNMKFPGVYAAYAVIMAVLGESVQAIRLGLLGLNLLSILLIFGLGRRLISPSGGAVSALFFAVLSPAQALQGLYANAEHFVLPCALAAVLLLYRELPTPRLGTLVASGLLFGLAIVMKQQGAVFLALAPLLLWAGSSGRSGDGQPTSRTQLVHQSLTITAAALVPLLLMLSAVLALGTFDRFYFWTIQYASQYITTLSLSEGWDRLIYNGSLLFEAGPFILVLAAAGLLSLRYNEEQRKNSIVLLSLALISFIAVCPGFYFRRHYFILLLPAICLLAAAALERVRTLAIAQRASASANHAIPIVGSLIAACFVLWTHQTYFFQLSPSDVTRHTYGENPFLEAVVIGRYIKQNSDPDDRIAVIGSEPEIYFYSNRKSASGYIYTYGLMEKHSFAESMQRNMAAEIEAESPKFLVYVNSPYSWLSHSDSPKFISQWFEEYRRAYDVVAWTENHRSHWQVHWEPPSLWPPATPHYTLILRRRTDPVSRPH